jgi:sugar lactone lactonase YvrE
MKMKKTIVLYIGVLFFISFCCYAFAKPLPPQWTVAVKAGKDVLLTWELSSGSVKTNVLRKKKGTESFQTLSTDALGFFMDKGVSPGTYIYKLQAVDITGNLSDFSEERYIVIKKEKNLIYSPPKWSESFSSDKSILIRWEDTCDVPVRSYNIYKKMEGEKEFKLYQTLSKKSFKDKKVVKGKKISYKVCPLGEDLKELECSPPNDFVVQQVKGRDKGEPVYDFVVRKTKFEKFLWLPNWKPLITPTDITVDISGKIYVSETGSGLIHIFKYNGTYDKSVGRIVLEDAPPEEFENLLGIDVSDDGIIYGVDSYKGIIKGFDQEGLLVLKIDLDQVFSKYKEYDFKKYGLVDVSVDNKNKTLLIVDNFNNHIYKFTNKGKFLGVFLDKGQKNGMVHLPTFSYVDKEGNLLLSDTMNQRISLFDKEMTPTLIFGRQGDILGTFIRPKGIAKDKDGNIFVADSFTNSIQVFSPVGGFKYILGDFRASQIDMATPNGIFVDKNNKLYIVERLVNRIQIRVILDDIITKKR